MKKIINSTSAPEAIGPYNHACIAQGLLFASGQIAINPKTGELVTESIEKETTQVLKNIYEVLAEANLEYEDIVKCTIFIKNMDDYPKINKVYAEFFPEESAPARELVEVSELPKQVNIEISVIASTK